MTGAGSGFVLPWFREGTGEWVPRFLAEGNSLLWLLRVVDILRLMAL